MEQKLIKFMRWAARIIGILLLITIFAVLIGEGAPNPLTMTFKQNLLAISLFAMVIGVILAFFWEGIGGALILIGWIDFSIINRAIKFNSVMGTFLILGLIFLFCWLKSGGNEKAHKWLKEKEAKIEIKKAKKS